jgi:hypothetical protein
MATFRAAGVVPSPTIERSGAGEDGTRWRREHVVDVVRRGRRGVRLRRAGAVPASVVTACAVATGVTTWAGGNTNNTGGVQPAGTPGTTVTIDVKTGQPLPLQASASKLTDAQIINRCKVQDNHWRQSSHKAGGGTESVAGWKVAVNHAKGSWLRAILVSPDHKRWAVCQDNQGSGAPYDSYLREDLKWQKDFRCTLNSTVRRAPIFPK